MSDKRRALGRGLAALLPGVPEPIHTLPVEQLAPSRHQPRSRFDDAALDELAASIRAQGMIQPIIVNPLDSGTYMIIAGERRWRAAQRAGLARVPVVVREVRDERQLLELALVENLQRTDLNPIEEAGAFRALVDDFGLAHEEVAGRVGRSRSAVTNALRLLKLPAAVQELLRTGQLSAGQARPLLALDDPAEIERLALRIVRDGLSARDVEALTGGEGERGKRRARRAAEPHAAAAADKLTQRLQTRVEIERRGKGGVIRIHFHSEEELMRLFDDLVERPRGR